MLADVIRNLYHYQREKLMEVCPESVLHGLIDDDHGGRSRTRWGSRASRMDDKMNDIQHVFAQRNNWTYPSGDRI